MGTVSSVPDSTRPHPPTPRLDEEAGETRFPDVAPWSPPEAEALRTRPQPPLTGRPTPPLDLPLPVLVLTEQARRVPEAERPELASRLNALLEQMAEGAGDRHVADTFHRLLETGKLEGLVDARGRSCRAVAVEALLSLGYPYALEVRPEDLEHLRSAGRGLPRTGLRGPLIPSGVLLAGLGAQIVQELTRPGGPDSLVTTQVGLAVLALMALWLAPPRSPVYRLGLALLALVSALALGLPLVVDTPAGMWAGVAGLVAVFLAALRES
ncbi:hypothetical protein [Myxococcus sp. RHSTA-1-4]|uniref:hypothetical protein n=1 Tax=Myxococcus sp. RHSTA-1-4 TaxID=2874601 RepID=UPI001CBFE894|nr:hypothetical protein [Myxococcus sp. RHSTA-1-4]MBZ4414896.1 hypothetical protein [Myxococcus sp. RHSTA-1-4]